MIDSFTTHFIHKAASRAAWDWRFNGEPVEVSDLSDPSGLAPLVVASALFVYNRCVPPRHAVSSGIFTTDPRCMLHVGLSAVPPVPSGAMLFLLNYSFDHELVPLNENERVVDLARFLDVFQKLNAPALPMLSAVVPAIETAPAQTRTPEPSPEF